MAEEFSRNPINHVRETVRRALSPPSTFLPRRRKCARSYVACQSHSRTAHTHARCVRREEGKRGRKESNNGTILSLSFRREKILVSSAAAAAAAVAAAAAAAASLLSSSSLKVQIGEKIVSEPRKKK